MKIIVHYIVDGEHRKFEVSGDTLNEIRQKSHDMKKLLGINTIKNNCWSEKVEE